MTLEVYPGELEALEADMMASVAVPARISKTPYLRSIRPTLTAFEREQLDWYESRQVAEDNRIKEELTSMAVAFVFTVIATTAGLLFLAL